MDVTFSEASTFKKIVDALKDLASECNIQFDSSGLHFQTMDASHVALCSCYIDVSKFEDYACEEGITLGIHFGSLTKLLRCANPMDTMKLSCGKNPSVLDFEFKSKSEDKITNFEMKLMDIDQEQLGIPEQDYDIVFKMSSSEFQSICQNLMLIDDTVSLKVTRDTVTFESNGELGKASIQLKNNQIEMNTDEPDVTAEFALRYFNFFTKATPLSPIVVIRLSPDYPIVIEYHLDTIADTISSTDLPDTTKNSYLKYYLAPKMEN